MVAQAAVNREVVGSNPSIPATNHKGLQTLQTCEPEKVIDASSDVLECHTRQGQEEYKIQNISR